MADGQATATVRRLLALLAETAVHAGTGTQLGAVDLPIQRERHTEWPTIYGTGLKGVLRDHAGGADWSRDLIQAVFGPETDKTGQSEALRHAGALAISDARILLFPVRSVGPAFAWITCPLALARLRRDAGQAGIHDVPDVGDAPSEGRVVVPVRWRWSDAGVMLEEFAYERLPSRDLDRLGEWIAAQLLSPVPAYAYWRGLAQEALVLVTDDDFRDFVRHATEIVTRVRLKEDTKTVDQGALWTEENLPSDTLLYAFVAAWAPARALRATADGPGAVMERLDSLVRERPVLQVGGKETVGRGFVSVRLTGGNHA
jgi:CRISPR-associated protein Cmr4